MNIAVTGGLATGKSSVSMVLASLLSAKYFSADRYCRQLLEVGASGWLQLRQKWGKEFFLEDNSIDRARVRETVFNDKSARQELEAILHPLVRKEQALLTQKTKNENRFLISEIPLLFENNLQAYYDMNLVVYAPHDIGLQRACRRDGLTFAMCEKIIASQMSIDEKVRLADYVIDNSGMKSATYVQGLHVCNQIRLAGSL